jgi:hypothetical protein
MLAAFIGLIFLFPFFQPYGLFVAQAKINPIEFVTLSIILTVLFVFLGWVYRQLRSAPVLAALQVNGYTTAVPKLAFGIGMVLVIFLAIVSNMILNGSVGNKAVGLARQKLGPSYSYAAQSIQWNNGHGHAVVAAYNDQEIKYITVEWSE